MKANLTAIVAATPLLLTACADIPILDKEPSFAPPPTPLPEIHEHFEGSLWRGEDSRRFLAFENRAKRVGDLVTVKISEMASAKGEATTDLETKREFDATVDSDIALQTLITRPIRSLLSLFGFTDQKSDKNPTASVTALDAATETTFEGDGSTEREATFETTIACLVMDVSPSGLLQLRGERYLTINGERQRIELSGYVRPEDIELDNTVPSSLIANADIRYGGRGVIADKQRVPLLSRALEWILPF